MGQFGYRAVFLFSGVLAIPPALASCAAGALQEKHSRGRERSERDAPREATPLIPDAFANVEAEAAAGEHKSYGGKCMGATFRTHAPSEPRALSRSPLSLVRDFIGSGCRVLSFERSVLIGRRVR